MSQARSLDVGDTVPALPLPLSNGLVANTADHAGHWLVLYFYPKDATPGCTTEGNDFNRLLPKFTKLDATVIGISRDSAKSHESFRTKHGFRFDLASDTDEALCNAFGVIKPKQLYGREYIGIERSTFLIGPDSTVVEAWRGVRVPQHASAVLDALAQHARQRAAQ